MLKITRCLFSEAWKAWPKLSSQWMYNPRTLVIKYFKLGGFKQQRVFSQSGRQQASSQCVSEVRFTLVAPGKNQKESPFLSFTTV